MSGFDPLVPRALDLPTAVPLSDEAELSDLDQGKILAAPSHPGDWPRWRAQLLRWRTAARERLDHDGLLYERADLGWTRSCFVIAQVWLWDELLYDFDSGTFTPDRLLADARARFGGFDGVVLWHAYPVIGIDDRNQWDYYRLVPRLRELVDRLHAAGVRVFLDYNPWDTGTRRGGADADELAALVAELDADGVFLDTLKEGGPELLERLAACRPGVAVEGESTLPSARLADHPMSWAQWFADSDVPGVVRAKVFEQRHLLHHVRRWHRDHLDELQSAWLNGVGVMVWEVVFGSWVGWNERDASILRRMAAAQRGCAELLADGRWTPLVDLGPEAAAARVFGSSYTTDEHALLTLVNKGDREIRLRWPVDPGRRAFDVWTGSELPVGADGSVTVGVLGAGIGGVVTAEERPGWLTEAPPTLVAEPAGPTTRSPGSAAFPYRTMRRLPPPPVPTRPDRPEPGEYVLLPAGRHRLTVRYRCRETGMYGVAPFVDEWKPLPPRLHDRRTLERRVSLPRRSRSRGAR